MDKVFGLADAVTTPTLLSARKMLDHGFSHGILPVSNGIDAKAYEPRPGDDARSGTGPTVLFVGRLAVEKNVDVLIDAFARIPADLHARLEIVGAGERRSALQQQVAVLNLGDKVIFRGLVSDDELRKAYIRASVFAMAGTADLQSLVSLEAMSASTPLVLADALALPHLVAEGVNGYLFAPGDSVDLADKLCKILSMPERERVEMGRASRAMVEHHSFDASIATFESLYRGRIPEEGNQDTPVSSAALT